MPMRKLSLDELNRLDQQAYSRSEKVPLTIIADNIRSGLNVGSFFRTCDAFACEQIVLCGISAQPPHKEINKTAIGADQTVRWSYVTNVRDAILSLKAEGYVIVAIEQTDESIPLSDLRIQADKKYAVVLGNEVEGVSESILDVVDHAVEISQYGTKHSLNVSVCAGIVLWSMSSQLRSS